MALCVLARSLTSVPKIREQHVPTDNLPNKDVSHRVCGGFFYLQQHLLFPTVHIYVACYGCPDHVSTRHLRFYYF